MDVPALERSVTAGPKGRPKRSDRDDVTVRIDRTIVGKAILDWGFWNAD